MSKLVESAKRPEATVAIEQSPGVWLVSDDAKEAEAKAAAVTAATLPHPAGGGRRMLRQVPAGVVLIEVVDGKPDLSLESAATGGTGTAIEGGER